MVHFIGVDNVRMVADALGLDPDKYPIREVTLDFKLDDMAIAKVIMLLHPEQLGKVIEQLEADGFKKNVEAQLYVQNRTNWFVRLYRRALGKSA